MPGHPGTTPWLEHIIDALPRVERGELQCCHQRKMDPDHWRIPTKIQPGEFTGTVGGPDTLRGPRSHSVRGTQR